MNRITVFRLKNTLMIANLISNAIGVAITIYLSRRTGLQVSAAEAATVHQVDLVFLPISFLVPMCLNLWYEMPIRRYLNRLYSGTPVTALDTVQVQRRLLNEPLVLICISASIWVSAGIVYPAALWRSGLAMVLVQEAFFRALHGGLVTVTVAFFVLEFLMQRRLCPVIFPNGGLSRIPGTYRFRIRTRLFAVLLACNLIPMFLLTSSVWATLTYAESPELAAQVMYDSVTRIAIIFAAIGVWTVFLVSSSLTRSTTGMLPALKAVRSGRFDARVRVTSNDEIGYAGDVINEMTAGLRERDFIKETFGKYVSREIRDEILSKRIPLDGELKEVTLLFADLRNFTPLVERTSPKDVVKIINSYFEEMEKIITAHNGLVLQFIGDEIEAVFGAPIAMPDHPDKALQAALTMQEHLDTVNQMLTEQGHAPLTHGIGVHTGEVVAANIGSPHRLSYALVGDTVNVASRLQDMNKQFDTHIIASETTLDQATQHYPLEKLPATHIRGKSQKISIFGC